MKKMLFSILCGVAVSVSGLFAEAAPVFDAPNAFVFDAAELPRMPEDNIRFVNLSGDTKVLFSVYVYSQKKQQGVWEFYGDAKLKELNDSDCIDSVWNGNLKRIRYFAVIPQFEKTYRYSVNVRHGDLVVTVFPGDGSAADDTALKASAFIIDTNELHGRLRDEIEFENLTQDTDVYFTVYAFNDKSKPWVKVGCVHLEERFDTEDIDLENDRLSQYRYFAVAAENGKQYSFSAVIHHHDLLVQVK